MSLSSAINKAANASEMRFSAYHPRAIPPDTDHQLFVYAHLASAQDAIATDAGQILGKEALQARLRYLGLLLTAGVQPDKE